jgi:hypothetical protein
LRKSDHWKEIAPVETSDADDERTLALGNVLYSKRLWVWPGSVTQIKFQQGETLDMDAVWMSEPAAKQFAPLAPAVVD